MTQESKIRRLPDALVKKIAAGEVVERPASVIKELLDNAIDATATRIAVEIRDGGKEFIRVTDDGFGMTAEELKLSVIPHATSKLPTEQDLYEIGTMGFRGEALASISSISKLRILSRPGNQDEAFEIRVVAEEVESTQAAGAPIGTTVEVRDLFFNVPTRRKFLRANATEVGHINDQVARAALAHHAIGFELTNNGRVTHKLPACREKLERIAKHYGTELASDLMHTQRCERGITLDVYAAPPAQSRASAQWQFTYVNNRYIRDRFIQHAIKEAHRGLTEPNRHGVVFLFLTVDPSFVDVNVHPTKIEVRWADSNLIHSQVLSALREMFQQAELSPALRTHRAQTDADPHAQDRARRDIAAMLKATPPIVAGDANSAPTWSRSISDNHAASGESSSPGMSPTSRDGHAGSMEAWKSLYGSSQHADQSTANQKDNQPLDRFLASGEEPQPRAIQLHNLYLVAETEDGIVIIDQHALHERVMFEELSRRIMQGPLQAQRLLLPESVKLTSKEIASLVASEELLVRLGIEITQFGTDSVAVHAFPAILKDTDVVGFVRDLAELLTQRAVAPEAEEVIHAVLDMMSCKAAVKAGDPLSETEIAALLAKRHLIDKASSCPHGRPTMLRLSRADLDRQFKRT